MYRLDVSQIQDLFPRLSGDYNRDGVVDGADYIVWRRAMQGGGDLAADGSRDGVVDQADYDVWRTHFGQTAGNGAGAIANAAVPEPATMVMLMLALAGWCLRRGRAE